MTRITRAARAVAITATVLTLAGTARAQGSQIRRFAEEAIVRGLSYVMDTHPQGYGYLGFGCGFADLDGDGDPDIVLLGGADKRVGIFENDGRGHFMDRSDGSGIPPLPQASAFAAADVDGDGDLDLYITQLGESNILMRNDGGFRFTDVTSEAGVGDRGASMAPAFADFDGDGWLDIYVANYNGIVRGTERLNNVLYRNLGGGRFEDVSAAQTVDDDGLGFQPVWIDFDKDGDVDLYLSNDRGHLRGYHGNQLWRNDGGQLVNVSAGSGADVALFSMGVASGDFDANGWPDLYCTNIGEYEDGFNPLLLNQGDGTFVESSNHAGVDQYITSWGAIFFDFDNNGRLDLYVNNMWVDNALFSCDGSFPCTEIAGVAGVIGNQGVSFGSAVADVDADGDLDLLVNNLSHNVELFINHEGNQRSWMRLRLEGSARNAHAIGAMVFARVGQRWQMQEVLAGGNGYLGQNELVVHLGLGASPVADEVIVSWPGGGVTRTFTDLAARRVWTISQSGPPR